MMTSYAKKFTTKPRLHKIIVHIIWTYDTVRTEVFLSTLLLWELAHAEKSTSLISKSKFGGEIS